LLNKYLKCSVWRLALRYDIYIYIYVVRLLKVNDDMSEGRKEVTGKRGRRRKQLLDYRKDKRGYCKRTL